MENKTITWKAQNFIAHEKTTLWYIVFAAVSAILIIYGLYTHNILTLVTFILLSLITFALSHQKPQEVVYEISATNIKAGQTVYLLRNIKKFWIIYTPNNKTLNIETTASLNNQFSLQLGKQDPLVIKQFLKNYLKEDLDKEESVTDAISRRIKF